MSGKLAIDVTHAYAITINQSISSSPDYTYATEYEKLIRNPASALELVMEFNSQLFSRISLPSFYNNMTRINSVFDRVRTGSKDQRISGLINDLKALKAQTSNPEAVAIYDIGLASAEYWWHESDVDGETALGIIELDCAGYLIGWSLAFHEDMVTGKDSGDKTRMRKGLHSAIRASVGVLMKP
jgi:hypothetical protein